MEKWKFLPQPGLELRTLGRPARRQSLYRLLYPGYEREREKKIKIKQNEEKREDDKERKMKKIRHSKWLCPVPGETSPQFYTVFLLDLF
jgi:hypothetical protein